MQSGAVTEGATSVGSSDDSLRPQPDKKGGDTQLLGEHRKQDKNKEESGVSEDRRSERFQVSRLAVDAVVVGSRFGPQS